MYHRKLFWLTIGSTAALLTPLLLLLMWLGPIGGFVWLLLGLVGFYLFSWWQDVKEGREES